MNSSPDKEWCNVKIVTPIIKAYNTDSISYIDQFLGTDVNAMAMIEFETKNNNKKKTV